MSIEKYSGWDFITGALMAVAMGLIFGLIFGGLAGAVAAMFSDDPAGTFLAVVRWSLLGGVVVMGIIVAVIKS